MYKDFNAKGRPEGYVTRFNVTFALNFGQEDFEIVYAYHNADNAIQAAAWGRREARRRFKGVKSVPAVQVRVW